jgi:DNA-directed RNA polymerase specialized sigma24 family protein
MIQTTVCDRQDDLLESCKKGDPKAQFQFYKLHYRAMYQISLNIVKDPVKAENIMRESFLLAFEKIGFFSEAVSFINWFKTFVKNRSYDGSINKGSLSCKQLA